jgi:hypothetical protein
MRHLTVALAVTLVGCAITAPVARTQVMYDPGTPPPLTARLYDAGGGGFTFDVSDDAFVAIFEIVPNIGTSIVYPSRPGEYNFVGGGHLRIAPTIIRPVGRWMYMNGYRSYWEPTYYYLVASRRPLALGPMLTRIGGVREALGWRQFSAQSPYATMELLAGAVLPADGLSEDDWTDDLLVSFPPPPVHYASRLARGSRLPVVQCADGRRHLAYDLPAGCFERESPVEPPERKPPRDSLSAPTSDPKERPAPKTPRKEIDAQQPELAPGEGAVKPRKVTVIADDVAGSNSAGAEAGPQAGARRGVLSRRLATRRSGRVTVGGETWSEDGPVGGAARPSYGGEQRRARATRHAGDEAGSIRERPAPRRERGARSSSAGVSRPASRSGRKPSSAGSGSRGRSEIDGTAGKGGDGGGRSGGGGKKPQ